VQKIRSEELTSKPPDVSALEEDIEKAEEELSEMEINLAKLNNKAVDAKEVIASQWITLSIIYLPNEKSCAQQS